VLLGDCRTWEVNGLRIANLTTAASPVIEEVRLTPLNRPLVENMPVRFPKSDRLLDDDFHAPSTFSFLRVWQEVGGAGPPLRRAGVAVNRDRRPRRLSRQRPGSLPSHGSRRQRHRQQVYPSDVTRPLLAPDLDRTPEASRPVFGLLEESIDHIPSNCDDLWSVMPIVQAFRILNPVGLSDLREQGQLDGRVGLKQGSGVACPVIRRIARGDLEPVVESVAI
jgi:hypothetical protein